MAIAVEINLFLYVWMADYPCHIKRFEISRWWKGSKITSLKKCFQGLIITMILVKDRSMLIIFSFFLPQQIRKRIYIKLICGITWDTILNDNLMKVSLNDIVLNLSFWIQKALLVAKRFCAQNCYTGGAGLNSRSCILTNPFGVKLAWIRIRIN